MKSLLLKSLYSFLLLGLSFGAFSDGTTPTIRVDYYHGGNADMEMFSLHQVVIEPLPWPGNPNKALDTTQRGYFRPEMNCIMFTREDTFCRVCSDAVEEMIDLYTEAQ